jgi:hypothetical protein
MVTPNMDLRVDLSSLEKHVARLIIFQTIRVKTILVPKAEDITQYIG